MKLENMMYRLSWFCISFALLSLSILILIFSNNRFMIFMGGMIFVLYLLEIVDSFKEAKNE